MSGIGEDLPKKTIKFTQKLFDSLNIEYNHSNSVIVCWNKYQVFVYENLNFESWTMSFEPEFLVRSVIVTNNYLFCTDCDGNIHSTALKLKNTHKRIKPNFRLQDKEVLSWTRYNDELILTLKIESGTAFLNLNRISTEFGLFRRKIVTYENQLTETKYGKTLLRSSKISEEDLLENSLFKYDDEARPESLVIFVLDAFDVYGCLLNQNEEEVISLKNLYSSPAEICSVDVMKIKNFLNILICLKTGSIVKLVLKDKLKPEIIHLNTALSKLIKFDENIIYSDGITLWETENTFTDCISFKQFFVKDIKDFIKINDQIICTTYSNKIYLFSIYDQSVYLSLQQDEYTLADKIINNSGCIYEIFEEIKKSDELKAKIKEETNHILTLSLSKRQDIMDTVIYHNFLIYDNYQEAIEKYDELILTHELQEYFAEDIFLLAIELKTTEQHQDVKDILSNLYEDLRVHVTLSTQKKLLQTASVKVEKEIKINILLPIKDFKSIDLNIDTEILCKIPGALDKNQCLWAVLYRKNSHINSEHFIKAKIIAPKNITSKQPQHSFEDLIIKTVHNQHGHLFNFIDIKTKEDAVKTFYVKLPNNYKEVLKSENSFKTIFSKRKAEFLNDQLSSNEFLNSKTNITFEIAKRKVKIEIKNDFLTPHLVVSSDNAKLAFNIRNFFSYLVYNGYKNNSPGIEFVPFSIYGTAEKLKHKFSKMLADSPYPHNEEFKDLMEAFYKSIFGALPL